MTGAKLARVVPWVASGFDPMADEGDRNAFALLNASIAGGRACDLEAGMSDDRNLLELAEMYCRLAAGSSTPQMVQKFRNLAIDYEAASRRVDDLQSGDVLILSRPAP